MKYATLSYGRCAVALIALIALTTNMASANEDNFSLRFEAAPGPPAK
jgi:hypothetical protein